mgnify:CR=1 FL=1
MKKSIFYIVLVLTFVFSSTLQVFATDNYDNYHEYFPIPKSDSSWVKSTLNNFEPVMGSTVNAKFQIRNGSDINSNAKIRVYHLPSYDQESATAACVLWDLEEATLLVESDLLTIKSNTSIQKTVSFVVDSKIFKVTNNNSDIVNNILFTVYSPDGSFKQACSFTNVPIDVISPEETQMTIDFTVKNKGELIFSDEIGRVCVRRKEFGLLAYDIVPNKFCVQIGELKRNQEKTFSIPINFAENFFSAKHTINDYLSVGVNRMSLYIQDSSLSDLNYDDNEVIFNLKIDEERFVVESDEIIPQVLESEGLKNMDLIKSPIHPSVYRYENGKRRPFPNSKLYHTWYKNFDTLKTITAKEMEAIPLGKPMSVKPKVGLVKFPYNPMVYEVLRDSVIRLIPSVSAAKVSYGINWDSKIVVLPEIYYLFYSIQK